MVARRNRAIRHPVRFSRGFWDFLGRKKDKRFFESMNLYAILAVAILGLGMVGYFDGKSGFLTGRVIGGEKFIGDVRDVIPQERVVDVESESAVPVVGFSTERFSLDELNFICGQLKVREIESFRAEDLCIVYPQKFDRISICQSLPQGFGALDCENLKVCFNC